MDSGFIRHSRNRGIKKPLIIPLGQSGTVRIVVELNRKRPHFKKRDREQSLVPEVLHRSNKRFNGLGIHNQNLSVIRREHVDAVANFGGGTKCDAVFLVLESCLHGKAGIIQSEIRERLSVIRQILYREPHTGFERIEAVDHALDGKGIRSPLNGQGHIPIAVVAHPLPGLSGKLSFNKDHVSLRQWKRHDALRFAIAEGVRGKCATLPDQKKQHEQVKSQQYDRYAKSHGALSVNESNEKADQSHQQR